MIKISSNINSGIEVYLISQYIYFAGSTDSQNSLARDSLFFCEIFQQLRHSLYHISN